MKKYLDWFWRGQCGFVSTQLGKKVPSAQIQADL